MTFQETAGDILQHSQQGSNFGRSVPSDIKQLFTYFEYAKTFQVDDKSQEIVLRKGKFTPSPTSRLHNDHLYQGSENDIVTTRIYSQDWICDFELSYYPFDVQFCKMIFTLKAILVYYI